MSEPPLMWSTVGLSHGGLVSFRYLTTDTEQVSDLGFESPTHVDRYLGRPVLFPSLTASRGTKLAHGVDV